LQERLLVVDHERLPVEPSELVLGAVALELVLRASPAAVALGASVDSHCPSFLMQQQMMQRH